MMTDAEPVTDVEDTAKAAVQRLGRYLIVGRAGAGAMGVVFRAYDPELDRKVAIKVLRPGAFGEDAEQFRVRLVREAQAMARLSHPNVVSIFDVGTAKDELFVAMEYVAGQTLREWLEESPRKPGEVLQSYLAAGRGLAAAHAAGLLHRDFKPDNVLVDKSGQVKVTDFGLARAVDGKEPALTESSLRLREDGALPVSALSEPLTRAGMLMGTPAYMAPEQFLGKPSDQRTEQFNFCVALWEGLNGERPFAGETYATLEDAVTRGRLRPETRPIPSHVRDALLRGLSVEREKRFESLDALLAVLAADPAAKRRPKLIAGAALVLVAAAATAAWGWQSSRPDPCPDPRAELAEVWSKDASQRLQAAFLGTKAVHSEFSALKTSQMLDAYADAWVAARSGACKAARVQKTRPEAEYQLQLACFARRRSALQQAVKVLQRATAAEVSRAQQVVLGLPRAEACADPDAEPIAPIGPLGTAAERVAIQELVDQASSELSLGRYASVITLAQPAAERAKAANLMETRAEALYLQGTAETRVKRTPFNQTLFEALLVADAAGSDAMRARALVGLSDDVRLVGTTAAWEQAHQYSTMAEAVIGRLEKSGKRVDQLRAHLHARRGYLLGGEGRYEEAVEQQRLTLRHLTTPHPHAEAGARDQLASSLSFLGRDEEALEEAGKSRALYVDLYGPAHQGVANATAGMAKALYSLNRLEEAATTAAKATELYEQLYGADFLMLSFPLRHWALATATTEPAKAIERARRAIVISDARGSAGNHTYFETGLGMVLLEAENPKEAEAAFTRGIESAAKTIGLDHVDTAEAYTGLGLAQEALGNVAAAGRSFRSAIAGFEKTLGATNPSLVRPLSGLGRVQLAAGARDEARGLLERALKIRATPIDAAHVAKARFALAQIASAQAEGEQALSLARQARDELTKFGRDPSGLRRVEAWLAANAK